MQLQPFVVIASGAKQSISTAAPRTFKTWSGGASRDREHNGAEDGLLRHFVPRNDGPLGGPMVSPDESAGLHRTSFLFDNAIDVFIRPAFGLHAGAGISSRAGDPIIRLNRYGQPLLRRGRLRHMLTLKFRFPKACLWRGPGAAPLALLRSPWRKHHHHLAVFHLGHLFHLGQRIHFGPDAFQHLHADVLVGHLTAAEA